MKINFEMNGELIDLICGMVVISLLLGLDSGMNMWVVNGCCVAELIKWLTLWHPTFLWWWIPPIHSFHNIRYYTLLQKPGRHQQNQTTQEKQEKSLAADHLIHPFDWTDKVVKRKHDGFVMDKRWWRSINPRDNQRYKCSLILPWGQSFEKLFYIFIYIHKSNAK